MKINQIVFLTISFFITNLIFAQQSNTFSVTGKVVLMVGQEKTIPINASVMIKSANKYAIVDSLGNFHIDSINVGEYHLIVQGFGHKSIDTLIKINTSNEYLNLLLLADCEIDKSIAQKDIEENKPRLLIIGGIAPTFFSDQHLFETKFGIKYYDYGDQPPPQECVEQYNREIFKLLDNKFGKSWRKEVRKDVAGLNNMIIEYENTQQ